LRYQHGGNLRKISEAYALKPGEILDFSTNINPAGFPDTLKELICRSVDLIRNYPDPESKLLKNILSNVIFVDSENIIPGNGSDELLFLALRCLAPKMVLIPVPSYIEYEHAACATGALCSFLKTSARNDFEINTDHIIKKSADADLVFLCNPNNPTGFLMDRDKIFFLIKKFAEKNIFLLMDEAFIDFTESPEDFSIIKYGIKFENVLVLRSLTKFFAIPGLRAGYAVGNRKVIRNMLKIQPTWPLNCFAQIAGQTIIENEDFIRKSKEHIKEEKHWFYGQLQEIHWIKPYYPSANFILCRIYHDNFKASELADFLIQNHNILIRDCSNFRGLGSYFFRIAVKKRQDNEKLLECLRNFKIRNIIK